MPQARAGGCDRRGRCGAPPRAMGRRSFLTARLRSCRFDSELTPSELFETIFPPAAASSRAARCDDPSGTYLGRVNRASWRRCTRLRMHPPRACAWPVPVSSRMLGTTGGRRARGRRGHRGSRSSVHMAAAACRLVSRDDRDARGSCGVHPQLMLGGAIDAACSHQEALNGPKWLRLRVCCRGRALQLPGCKCKCKCK